MPKLPHMPDGQARRCQPKRNGIARLMPQNLVLTAHILGEATLPLPDTATLILQAGIPCPLTLFLPATAHMAYPDCWEMAGSGPRPCSLRSKAFRSFRSIRDT